MGEENGPVRDIPRWVPATAIVGTIAIGLGAFWLSFTSLTGLTVLAGVPRSDAWIWPLIVDGIIVVATISVVALSPRGRQATVYPWSLLIAGAAVSVAANTAHALIVADAAAPKALAACVWAVPPIVLLAITHLTVLLTRAAGAPVAHAPEVPATEGESAAVLPRRDEAMRLRGAGWSNRRIARQLGVHPSTVGRWVSAAEGGAPAAPGLRSPEP